MKNRGGMAGHVGKAAALPVGAFGHHHQDTRVVQMLNAGSIRQPGKPRAGLPGESGVAP